MDETTIRETLSTFGLSEKEVDAYLSVLRRGAATTRAVSEAAGVSQSYVYEIAASLSERGLVTVDESETPTVLRARPPEEAVDALEMQVAEFESVAREAYSEPERTEAGFEVVRSRRTVRRRARRHLGAADDELFCLLPAAAFETLREDLADAVDRGVLVYCLLTAPEAEGVLGDLADPGQYAHVVRTWDGRPPALVVADGDAGVLAAAGTLTDHSGEGYGVAFNQPEVGSGFFGNYLSNVWPMGEQRFVAEPPDLPATFDYFRSGVTTAALHTTAGRDVRADIAAVDAETGAERSFADVRVREVRQSLVEPTNVAFPIENALVVETDEGLASVGGLTSGLGPYYEEYAATEVTLYSA